MNDRIETTTYEDFVRQAFSLALQRDIDREGDPAGLAVAGLIDNDENMPSVKAAAIYSMEIFLNRIVNNGGEISEAEFERLENFPPRVFGAHGYREVLAIIREFNTTVKDKYYAEINGRLSLKP